MSPIAENPAHPDSKLPLRCVVLHHRVPSLSAQDPSAGGTVSRGDHFDWMFEVPGDGELWTFATPVIDLEPTEQIPMKRLPDHRRRYLDYEGPISNNRGNVTRIACGTHRAFPATSSCDANQNGFRTTVELEPIAESIAWKSVRQFQLHFQHDHWYCDSESSDRVRKIAGVAWDGFLTIQR
ncbi:hypothetical protein [Rhodopirellula bahusiensis]|uniref:hypothetical protein n=2 Tax=Rhodopirellula bahusiensis TaxID=2014065 RepID=UPI0032652C79